MKRSRLTSDPQKAREWQQNSRGSLSARSRSKEAERRTAQPAVDEVMSRDRGCVLRGHPDAGPCFGPLTPHHLRKQGQGGKWTPQNMVVLCSAMNSWVEDNPRRAHELGLVIRHGETEKQAWEKLQAAGLVSYEPSGGPSAPQENLT